MPVGRLVRDSMDAATQRERARTFASYHSSTAPLVLPNAWDAASALVFERTDHRAIGTSSSGIGASFGSPSARRLSLDLMLSVVARIADAVDIPVSADMEAGYGDTPDVVAETVRRTIEAGAVGVNLEDGSGYGSGSIASKEHHENVVRAARQAADETGVPLVINARTDVFWLDIGDEASRLDHALDRANAYIAAGADCVFIPGVSDAETIGQLVDGLDGPLNVLGGPGGPSIGELEKLGVARVSVGSGPMRSTLGHLREIGEELRSTGTYETMAGAIPYAEWNAFLAGAYDAE